MDYLKEAVIAHWGDRCPDYEPQCPCCIAWLQFDTANNAVADLYDLAARYDQLLDAYQTALAAIKNED